MSKRLVMLALLPFALCLRANAATTFCVDSAASLQAALDTSQADGDDDYINIVAGTYDLTAGLTYISIEDRGLILVGGFDAGCNGRIGETILDGQDTVRPLYVATNAGSLLVYRMTFQHGHAEGDGGGLFADSASGNLFVLHSKFIRNRSAAGAGALRARSDAGKVHVYGNLVHANRAGQVGGMVLHQGGGGLAINNTIVGNTTDALTVPGGLLLQGSGHFGVSNNIVWNNAGPGGADFRADAAHVRRHNDIGFVASSVAPDSVSGELSVDPQFVDCGLFCMDFELRRASPLVDAGYDADVADADPAMLDLGNRPRIIGPHVDIGANENDVLLEDGFDP